MTHFKRSAVNPNVNSVSQKVFSSNTPLSPLSHLLHLCFLSNLRPARASSLSASGDVLTGGKYPLSLKPNQRLSHPHSLFFSETPTTATCSAFPIPHPPLRRQGPPILPPIFSRLRLFSSGFLSNPSSSEINDYGLERSLRRCLTTIYEHWWQKRERKGMPLIRHLQPPLWERYQQEVKEWVLALNQNNTNIPNGFQEKAAPIEKPPTFAFCLKQ